MIKALIRQAKFDELSRIIYITKLAYKIPYKNVNFVTQPHESKDEQEQIKNKEEFIIVAIIKDKIVGAVRYKVDKQNNLYFFKLAVLKTYRGFGAGSLLIDKIEKIASKKGCTKLMLDCAQEKKLDGYYKKFGFKVDKIEEKIKHHVVYMSKKI